MSDVRVTMSLHKQDDIDRSGVLNTAPFKGLETVFSSCTVLILIQCPTLLNNTQKS